MVDVSVVVDSTTDVILALGTTDSWRGSAEEAADDFKGVTLTLASAVALV